MANKFRCSGQTCVCSNRVFVQQGAADRFVAAVRERVAALTTGPGLEPNSQVGPLIDRAGFTKVDALVRDALERGAKAVVGGATAMPQDNAGYFFAPTLLDHVSADARCLREEVFGPVIPIVRFASEADVVRAANDTEYGLAAYVFTADRSRAMRVVEQLHFGHVAINSGTGPSPEAPFGGMKQSGLGREGGDEGILEYVELQTVPEPESA
jgi:succinate-semialdehyde dehydrogenase/glutarate-semialdehyde dehydrogenase